MKIQDKISLKAKGGGGNTEDSLPLDGQQAEV